MKLKKYASGLYIYGDWMLIRLKMGWGLCTSWEYEQDERGLRCAWERSVYFRRDHIHKIRPVHIVTDTGYWHQSNKSTRGSLLTLVEEIEKGSELAPFFSKADLYYLRTQRLEDVPRLLAKWPYSRQLAELLTEVTHAI